MSHRCQRCENNIGYVSGLCGTCVEADKARIEELEAALRSIQWKGELGHWDEAGCPDCGNREVEGHRPDCLVGRALRPTT